MNTKDEKQGEGSGSTNMKNQKLVREQLDATLQRFQPLKNISPPKKGWIRAIRDALGMTAKQLARRLQVAQQAIARIENNELAGAVTIKTMRRVAEGLDCVFVYGLVPRSSLESTLLNQADRVVTQRLARASQTMALEDQALSLKEKHKMHSQLRSDLADKYSSNLWDEL